jgi:hypothetical protein
MRSLRIPLALLVAVWLLIIAIVNPVGEFMVNDDWSYVRALDRFLSEGRLVGTGWGPNWAPGGPSLLTHLMWGRMFTWVGGYSLTSLRMSVLTAALLGSLALFFLCRMLRVSDWSALWATLALILNPLFLSQSFTFMTDITFTCLTIFALLFFQLGVQRASLSLVAGGMFLCLCSVLTRQIGVVLAMAFVLACFRYPLQERLGKIRICMLAVWVVVVPWVAYEWYLIHVGGTSLFDHQVIHNIWREAREASFPDYVAKLYFRLFHGALVYSCLLVSPVLALRHRRLWASLWFRRFFFAVTGGFLVLETLLLAGIVDVPVLGLRNVIFNMGIGPVLLKDTYVLHISRVPGLCKPLYVLLVYGAVIAVAACVGLAVGTLRRFVKPLASPADDVGKGRAPARPHESHGGYRDPPGPHFMGTVSLLAALIYLGIITLTGFHDRYLIPVCLFLVVWLVGEWSEESDGSLSAKGVILGTVPLLSFGLFAIGGTADFMALKRAQERALDHMVHQLKVDPCRCDGGMEFNGYHCYRSDFEPVPGLSWWWVQAEDYVVTLGRLDGYSVVQIFPFHRILGPDGAMHILNKRVPEDASLTDR